MLPMRARVVLSMIAALAACSPPKRGDGSAGPAGSAAGAAGGSPAGAAGGSSGGGSSGGAAAGSAGAASAAAVPDGVLAERTGVGGAIRVEQRAGRRLLIIGDTVHAAVPWTAAGPDPSARDPLVGLLRLVRPQAKTALVIGLGSGRTATELAAAGLTVTAVELDPVVIELARAHFGYTGTAVAAEGLAYLRDQSATFDLVVMDAFAGARPPPDLVTPAALALLRGHTAAGGVTALRLLASPADPLIAALTRGLRGGDAHYQHVLGGGVGAEPQNLYVVASDVALNWRDDAGLALWPHFVDGEPAIAPAADGAAAEPGATPRERRVTLVGYVHRTADGALALDLAHWEMGAARYLLVNAPASLGAALPANARFPTQGDLATDGDTAATQAWLLGGGGVKRSDVRFSPVVAAVTGTARLVSVIHPDAASGLPDRLRGAVTDERLPWGGALYQLDVAAVHWTLDLAAGQRLAAAIEPALAAAGQRAAAGDLPGTAAKLAAATAAFDAQLGAQAALVPSFRRLALLATAIATEQPKAARGGFHAGAACDRLRERIERADPEQHLAALRRGFEDCAVVAYEQVTRTDAGADGYDAAARLLYLADPDRSDSASPAARKRTKLLPALRKKFQAQPQQFPPGWIQARDAAP